MAAAAKTAAGLVVLGVLFAMVVGSGASSSSGEALATASGARGAPGPSHGSTGKTFDRVPVWFEANEGQTDAAVEYLARGTGYTVFLTPNEAVVSLAPSGAGAGQQQGANAGAAADVVRLSLSGGNQDPELVGLDRLAGKSNYYGGAEPSQWREGVATYGSVAYREAYPGIDLVYHGDEGQVKFDFVVAPGADPGVISVNVEGGELSLDEGALAVKTSAGELRKPEPVIYQQVNGVREIVPGSYVLEGDGRFGFELGDYDPRYPLVIDPALAYSAALQGEDPYRIVVDAWGNAYIHGETTSATFPGRDSPPSATPEVFVAKLASDGTKLVYASFFGNRGPDNGRHKVRVYGLDIDSAGNAYVGGETLLDTIPVVGAGATGRDAGAPTPLICPTCPPSDHQRYDGFLTRLGDKGQVTFSTYLRDHMRVRDIAVGEAAGVVSVYLAGQTERDNLATTPNAVEPVPYNGPYEEKFGFLARVQPGPGSFYRYVTYFGNQAHIRAIAADDSGNAYVAGTLIWEAEGGGGRSVNGFSDVRAYVPIKNGFQSTRQQRQQDMFAAKIDTDALSSGASLVYSTYLSGRDGAGSNCPAPPEAACQGAMDITERDGKMYITGYSASMFFPTTLLALQTINSGSFTGFVSQIDPSLSGTASLLYSTFLGANGDDRGHGVVVHPANGNVNVTVTVTGQTASQTFPVSDALQDTYGGGASDGFVTTLDLSKLGPQGLVRSTFLGGGSGDQGRGVALDPAGDLYLRGSTTSGDFPTTAEAFSQGGSGGFVAKVDTPCTVAPRSSARVAARSVPAATASPAGVVGFGVFEGGLGLSAWATAAIQRRRRGTLPPSGRPKPPRRRRGESGFTLAELLVVVVILGILSAVVVFAVRGSGDKGQKAAIQTDERIIRTALETYCAQKGTYPMARGNLTPMEVLIEDKFLAGKPSVHHTLETGDLLPEGNCPGMPRHYRLTGPPSGTTTTTTPPIQPCP